MRQKDILYDENYKRDMLRKQNEVICSCGWKNIVVSRYNKVICRNCGNYVYLRKEDEFKDKLKNAIKELN